VKLSV